MMRNEIEIADELFAAKLAEKEANERRVALEEELIALVGAKEEGAQTHTIGDFKITITGKLNRKVDFEVAEKLSLGDLLPVKYKPELDNKGLKYLEEKEPAAFAKFAAALTIEPAKTAITVIRTEA